MNRSHCDYCQRPAPKDLSICPHCGMPLSLQREYHLLGIRLGFPAFVAVFSVVVLTIAFWLPR